MFGLFGSKKPNAAKGPKAPAAPKLRRVNLEKRFTIIAETGQGSMSRVYKALDNQAGRSICLKVQDKAKTAAAATRSSHVGRMTEGEIAVKVNHPHVVRTFDYGESTKGEYFLVMEFIDGVSLHFVRQSRAMDLGAKLEFLAQAAEGLAAVHDAGFIHHDYGPKNLLVNRDDRVKLIDFGLAVPNTAAFHRPGNRTGTLQYMAPELIRRDATDERLDIFSWGVMACEFLTGKLPYEPTADAMVMMRQRMNAEPLKLAKMAPHLPPELCDLIQKTIARKPKDRWPTMSTLAPALRELPVASG